MSSGANAPGVRLPDFPWDTLDAVREQASRHADGIVDLSIGTPVDPVPMSVRSALAGAADSPGYPTVHGTSELRRSYSEWLARAHGVPDLDPENVLPTVGSKELVAALPSQLGLGADDLVVIPELAYPTYEVGALTAGASILRADSLTAVGPRRPALIWINSASNPTGKVLPPEHMAKIVSWARARGTIVASDECYLDLGWESKPVSVLNPEVCQGDHSGLLAVHSLSKRSNLAGYRAGFVSGDPELIGRLLALRRHLGVMVPTPVQAAAAAALSDDGHVLSQRRRYQGRRQKLTDALSDNGFRIGDNDTSAAGLYLWATRGEPAMTSVSWLAERGILVAPGTLYGPNGDQHVRVALTALDERVAAAVSRLTG
ncbi:MAG: succinyldiaminopimelate transaminase [Actinomycetota bacterium]|nr:succinyldiaminopimelate transaminase [Actinomycetota bacterium]